MSEIRVDSIGNESNTGGPVLSGITTFSGQQYFIPPKGTTAERPFDCPPGSIRFNTDSAHLEYWNGLVWLEFEASSEELGDQNQTNSAGGTGTRGIAAGGRESAPAFSDIIEYITISTLGNAQDFGTLITAAGCRMSCSNATRGIWAGGIQSPGSTRIDSIEFVTIASTGDSQDFGDLSATRANSNGAVSSPTRGVFCGGYNPGRVDIMEYVTIPTTGNVVDFGNLSAANQYCGGCSNGHGGL